MTTIANRPSPNDFYCRDFDNNDGQPCHSQCYTCEKMVKNRQAKTIKMMKADSPSEIKDSLTCGRFTISKHPDLPNGKKVIWMESEEGEGTTIDVEKLFKWSL